VRELIEEAVIADGIQILVKQVSLFTPEFEEKLQSLRSEEARASEIEHAIKNEIHVRLEEDPAFYTSLRERLEKLIADRKAKRIDAAQQLKLFEALRSELRGRHQTAEDLGMSETGLAIYGLIAEPAPLSLAEPKGTPYRRLDEAKKELAEILEEQLTPQVEIVDWVAKDEVQREMRRLIKRQLKAAGIAEDKRETISESIVDLMKRRRPR
jgi:type I restriction enzyme, R subunit